MISCGIDPDRRQTVPPGTLRKGCRAVWLAEKPSRTDNVLFILGLSLLAAGLGFVLFQRFAPETAARLRWPFPCAFYSLLHIPCLGCGATRALRALARGKLLESFLWHPAVPFAAAAGTAYLLSQTLGRLSRGKLRMLTFNDLYIYALLAVILLQWIVKLISGWTP